MTGLTALRYRNDPIIEVVCEFRFTPGIPWDPTIPGLVFGKVEGTFPKRGVIRSWEGLIGGTEQGLEQHMRIGERAKLAREDDLAFIQIAPNLLAVNHLKPYPTWEKYLPLVRQGFGAYREVASPQGLSRIGLRYINRIEFPAEEQVEIAKYFRFAPSFPGEETLKSFSVGVEAVYEDGRDVLKTQLGSVLPAHPGMIAVIFDLDYSVDRPESIALDQALEWVDETAHTRIQERFEASLTDELKSRFDPVLD